MLTASAWIRAEEELGKYLLSNRSWWDFLRAGRKKRGGEGGVCVREMGELAGGCWLSFYDGFWGSLVLPDITCRICAEIKLPLSGSDSRKRPRQTNIWRTAIICFDSSQ